MQSHDNNSDLETMLNNAEKEKKSPAFSFEILPPLKGNNIDRVFNVIDKLREFEPRCVNITAHHSESVYQTMPDGSIRRINTLKRPGTVAIAAVIQNKYKLQAVPHIICSGFTREETEYALIDLNFLGVSNLFLLRGDNKNCPIPAGRESEYNAHATDLQRQVNEFNRGFDINGDRLEGIDTPFSYGMACYPEKHEEAPNMESDLRYLKMKVDAGAEYIVTQMFFDNSHYYSFVERCRREGIVVPIIPGIKPIVKMRQLNVLPRVYHTDIPEPVASELARCKSDDEARQVGTRWCICQCRDLIAHGVPALHFYTYMASDSVREVAAAVL